jgi:hypothetical protein
MYRGSDEVALLKRFLSLVLQLLKASLRRFAIRRERRATGCQAADQQSR